MDAEMTAARAGSQAQSALGAPFLGVSRQASRGKGKSDGQVFLKARQVDLQSCTRWHSE